MHWPCHKLSLDSSIREKPIYGLQMVSNLRCIYKRKPFNMRIKVFWDVVLYYLASSNCFQGAAVHLEAEVPQNHWYLFTSQWGNIFQKTWNFLAFFWKQLCASRCLRNVLHFLRLCGGRGERERETETEESSLLQCCDTSLTTAGKWFILAAQLGFLATGTSNHSDRP